MIPLGAPLPVAIRIGGADYPVRWDWQSCIKIILAFESAELLPAEQLELMVELLYKKRPPHSGEVYQKAVRFLNFGEGEEPSGGSGGGGRLYSFTKDAGLIYAAFRQSHGIDLHTEPLHWWAFGSLFLSLSQDCLFCRVVALRQRKRRGLLTPEERRQVAEMGQLLALPEQYSADEERRIQQFVQQVNHRD